MRLYKFKIEISTITSAPWVVCHDDDREDIPTIVEVTGCNQPMNARYVRIYRDQVQPRTIDERKLLGVILNFCEFQVFGLYTLFCVK